MKKKLMSLCLVVALAATAVVGGTLAYFTDTDNERNEMTLGKLNIDVFEKNADGEDFDETEYTIMPGEANKIDKQIWTKLENGSVESYVRNIVLLEVTDEQNGWNWSDNIGFTKHLPTETATVEWVEGVVTIDGVPYVAGVFYPASVTLEAGEEYCSINYIWLNDRVTSAEVEALGTKYNVLTLSQAVQYEGNTAATAKEALDAAFGAITLEKVEEIFNWVKNTVD